jgi:UDP-N-acetylmuramate dehydrogenase
MMGPALMWIQENVPLAPLTTFGIGGPARYFVHASEVGEVRSAVQFSRLRQVPLLVLGGGSNLVISDQGWPGMVLRVGIPGIEESQHSGKAVFEVGAGEDWDGFVARAVERECAGVECLSGIPGSVGGTPVQNVGAYGQEVSETIDSVQVLDLKDGQVRELCNPACGFAYRSSIFNTSERGRYIILRVVYHLAEHGEPVVRYADLQKFFGPRDRPPNLAETRDAVRQIRAAKGMLIVAGDGECHSAGSFFKNPVLGAIEYDRLRERAAALGLELPSYPAADAGRKVSAAWLVERSGFQKGYARGPVGISRKHALALVNRGGATAADLLALKSEIQDKVEQTFGIRLQPEPVFMGFDPPSPGSS